MKTLKKIFWMSFGTLFLIEMLVRIAPIDEKQKEVFSLTPVASLEGEQWFKEILAEQNQLHRRFQEYEIYSLQPFQGKHIKISEDGYRESSNPKAQAGALRVGVFGGSTIWGGWARQAHTVPSEFSAALAEKEPGTAVEISNYGQVGYVFSQEAHQAFRILSSHKPSESPPPRVMIFLDGVCDALATMTNFMHGTNDPAGKPWEFEKYAYLFQLGKTGEVSAYDIVKKSKAVRLASRIAEKYGWKEVEKKNVFIQPTPQDLERLAEQTGQAYLSVLTSTHRALTANGILPIFILQPALYAKEKKSDEEEILAKENAHWLPYVGQTYAWIQKNKESIPPDVKFVDWSRLFDGDERTLYADVMHYSENGNAVIGKALANEFGELIRSEAQKLSGDSSSNKI